MSQQQTEQQVLPETPEPTQKREISQDVDSKISGVDSQTFVFERTIFKPLNLNAKRKIFNIPKPSLTTDQLFEKLFNTSDIDKNIFAQDIKSAIMHPKSLEKLFINHKSQGILNHEEFELYKELIFQWSPETKFLYEINQKVYSKPTFVKLDYESQKGSHTYKDDIITEIELSQNEFFHKSPSSLLNENVSLETRDYTDPVLLQDGQIFAYDEERPNEYSSSEYYINEIYNLIKESFSNFNFTYAKEKFDSWMNSKLKWTNFSRIQLEELYKSLKPQEKNTLQEFFNGCYDLLINLVTSCARSNPSDLSENTKGMIKDCFDHIFDKFDYNSFIITDVIDTIEIRISDVQRMYIHENVVKEEHIVKELVKLKELSQTLKEKTLQECFHKVIQMKRSAMFLIKLLLKHNLNIRDEEINMAKQYKQSDIVIKLLEKHKQGESDIAPEDKEKEFFKNVGKDILGKMKELLEKSKQMSQDVTPIENIIPSQESDNSVNKIELDIKIGEGRFVCEFQNLDVQMIHKDGSLVIKIRK